MIEKNENIQTWFSVNVARRSNPLIYTNSTYQGPITNVLHPQQLVVHDIPLENWLTDLGFMLLIPFG